jgi:hypothetical protein
VVWVTVLTSPAGRRLGVTTRSGDAGSQATRCFVAGLMTPRNSFVEHDTVAHGPLR